MVEGNVELVDGVGPEGVTDLRPIEGHANRSAGVGAMVCDVGEIEAGHEVPRFWVKYLRNHVPKDKGQNQVVTDWLMNGPPDQVFISTPDGALTYRDLTRQLPRKYDGDVRVVVPDRTIASIVEIFSAIGSGPVVLSSGRPWRGSPVPRNVMTVLFTSGTTGKPKAVPLSSDNWRAAVSASAAHLGLGADDQWLVAMPLHRVGGLAVLLRSAFVGARVRMLPSFDAVSFADELGEATLASVVPTMLRRVLDVDDRHYRGLRAVLVGGGPIPPGLLEEAFARGIPALPTYGMTETCAQVATLRPGSRPAYKADLVPGVEARIERDGRIALRGPQIFSGYLGELPRGKGEWYRTGDRGSLDSGALRIEGRADGIIVSGGENVDPNVVEAVVRSAAGVDDAVVIGVPSAEWGAEVVCLYAGTADPGDLDQIARDELERFEVPKRWISVNSVPRDEMGKVDRETSIAMVEGT